MKYIVKRFFQDMWFEIKYTIKHPVSQFLILKDDFKKARKKRKAKAVGCG